MAYNIIVKEVAAVKKKNILNLIKYYSEKNDAGFRNEAYEIARDFDENGDYQLAEYVMALLSNANTFVPQINEMEDGFLKKVKIKNDPLPLPEQIQQDVIGVINAINHRIGVNKFLLEGMPGTGKTETVKQIARILERELYMVDFAMIVDSKLGQTQKNIAGLFNEINSFPNPNAIIILFDEIDSIALDRTNSNDLREMGRATSAILKELDDLDENIVIVATTNLYKHFDRALCRRFDSIISFDRYAKQDLVDIAEILLNDYLNRFKFAGRNIRLFKKIISLMDTLLMPGELKNIIKTSIAFSNPGEEYNYLKRIYQNITNNTELDIKTLRNQGFTVREIEILTGVSKSQVARELKE